MRLRKEYNVLKIPAADDPKIRYGSNSIRAIWRGQKVVYLPEQAITFEAPPGKVVYLGTVNLEIKEETGQLVNIEIENRMDEVVEFMKENYPNLSGVIEYQPAIAKSVYKSR